MENKKKYTKIVESKDENLNTLDDLTIMMAS
jgi:hypothetical protein